MTMEEEVEDEGKRTEKEEEEGIEDEELRRVDDEDHLINFLKPDVSHYAKSLLVS